MARQAGLFALLLATADGYCAPCLTRRHLFALHLATADGYGAPHLTRRHRAVSFMAAPPPLSPLDNLVRAPTGSLAGAIALVAGTTVGAGVLALPARTLAAGFVPSSVALLCAWAYMAASGLLIAEVNVNTLCALDRKAVSISSMAEVTLGPAGARLSSAAYCFIHYTLLVAYILQGGTLLTELVSASPPLASVTGGVWAGAAQLGAPAYALGTGGALLLGSAAAVEAVNNVLVAGVVGSFGALLLLGAPLVQPALLAHAEPAAVLPALPVMALSLVYHNVVPSICNSLGCDLPRIRTAVIAGSALPTLMFIAWSAVILGSVPYDAAASAAAAGATFDPLQALRAGGGIFGDVVRIFSLLAVTTSFVGFAYGLTDFFADVLGWEQPEPEPEPAPEPAGLAGAALAGAAQAGGGAGGGAEGRPAERPLAQKSALYALTVLPPLAIALYDPSVFFAALDNAGTYGILTLFGIVPAAMAYVQRYGDGAAPAAPDALPGGKGTLLAMVGIAAAIIGVETWERLAAGAGAFVEAVEPAASLLS